MMLDADIFVKTDAGRDEIKSRALGLPMSIRAILVMIDGQRTVSSIRTIIAGSKAPADVLDSLISQGLIEPRGGAPVTAAPKPPAPVALAPVAPRRTTEPAVAQSMHVPKPTAPAPFGNAQAFSYDGPLDLTLPTILASESATVAPTDQPAAAGSIPAIPAAPVEAAAPINRYEHLYAMMNEIVRDFLSPTRRYFFQLKIERAGTPDELLELLHDLQTALAKSRGEAFAVEVIARVRAAAG